MWNVTFEENGEETEIYTGDSYDDCFEYMKHYIKETLQFTSYYYRVADFGDNEYWIDYGSHTKFFWIKEVKE